MTIDQLEYRSNGNGISQCERIFDALRQWPAGEWCPMPHLARCASPTGDGAGLAVHSRIADLRRALKPQGWTIECGKVYINRVCRPNYRLARITGVETAAPGGTPTPTELAGSASEATAPAQTITPINPHSSP